MIWVIIAILVGTFLVAVPMILGYYLIYVGLRFKKSTDADQTAFWSNWLVFVWSWAEQSDAVVAAMPFFRKDITETFGIRKDDGKIT